MSDEDYFDLDDEPTPLMSIAAYGAILVAIYSVVVGLVMWSLS